jgi:DNA primase
MLLAQGQAADQAGIAEWFRRELGIDVNPDKRRIVATYDYTDEKSAVLFQVVRFADHKFLQRRPDGTGGWTWKLDGVRRVLYRLPEVLAAKASRNGHPWRVYLCEGEKDCDRLRKDWGVTATTNPGGAGNWEPEFDASFAGSETILLEDNDEAGRKRSAKLAPRLTRAGAIVKVVRFPHLDEGGDISDWLDDGGLQSDLETLIEEIPPFELPGAGTGDHSGPVGREEETMPFDSATSAAVRPTAETGSRSRRHDLETSPDFDRALCAALAPLNQMMPQRQRAEALARARREILAAAAALMKAERRRVVQMTSPAQLRDEVLELVNSHEALLDYIDDLERQPVIAREVKRLRSRGEIPWPL